MKSNSQYRMRETSDHQPILVPEYRFSGSVFPNRNSLSEPQPALQLQPPDSPTHSILRRPPSAVLRSPLQETFPSQGDYAEDSRPPSPIAPPSPTLPRGLFTSNRHRSDSRTPIISITPSLAPPSTTSLPSQIPNTHNRESLQPPPHHVRTPTPSSSRRQSWLDRILQSPRPRSDRPSKFLRRSLTPRLYNAHEVAMSARREQDNDDYVREMQEEYEAQRRVGRLVMLLCLLFPCLLYTF